MQTCPREAARAGKPRIGERIGVRVLSAPAASCSHCLQRAAARRAGALLPSASLHSKHMGGQNSVHADCLRKRWGAAYPASVTPQAGERSAHLAAPSKLQKALRPSSSTCLKAIFISETTSFQLELRLRNHIFSGAGQSASGRLQRGWGGLGGGWRRERYWYSSPQHTSMTVSTRACRGRAMSPNTSNARDARAGLLGSRPPAPVQTASRALVFPAKSLKFAGKASQLNLAGNSTTRSTVLAYRNKCGRKNREDKACTHLSSLGKRNRR